MQVQSKRTVELWADVYEVGPNRPLCSNRSGKSEDRGDLHHGAASRYFCSDTVTMGLGPRVTRIDMFKSDFGHIVTDARWQTIMTTEAQQQEAVAIVDQGRRSSVVVFN